MNLPNYRQGAMIDIIGNMGSAVLGVQANRCLLVRNRNAECLRCADVCTTGALSLAGEGIRVNPGLCIGCGTCASACPTGCLEARNPTDEELFGRAQDAVVSNQGTLVLACGNALGCGDDLLTEDVSLSLADGRVVRAIPVVCLGRVDESLLLESVVRGATAIRLVRGVCDTCAHAVGGRRFDAACDSVRDLLLAAGLAVQVERANLAQCEMPIRKVQASEQVGKAFACDAVDSNRGNTCDAKPHAPSGDSASHEVDEGSAPSAPVFKFVHVQADGTLPHHVPQRRLRLFNCLSQLNFAPDSSVETRLWGDVAINVDVCRSCRMCTVFCPTGALTRFEKSDGTFGVDHRAALCTQCRTCEAICPEHALTVSGRVNVKDFVSGATRRFVLQPVGWNPGGANSIATRMTRFMKTDTFQDPQATMKPSAIADQRDCAQEKDAKRRAVRGE